MKALVFDTFGSSDVLQYRDIPEPALPPGHILLDMRAIGLNFADIYRRRGHYHLAGEPPYIAGYEGAGIVAALGEGVTGFAIGDRIGFADCPFANAQRVAVPIEKAIPLPEDVDFTEAAAILLQGLTAQYLVSDSYAVRHGDLILVHAAAGGVGQALVQLVLAKGGRVIGMASTEEKRAAARAAGAEAALGYDGDWPARVLEMSDGGVHAVYDSIGSTLAGSIAAVRDRGALIFFGMAGGDPEAVDPKILMDRSLRLIGGDLWSYLDSCEARLERAGKMFAAIRSGALKLPRIETFDLSRGASAHLRLEDRSFFGKIVMTT